MNDKIVTGVLLDERVELSLTEISRTCATSTEWIIALVEEGALEPAGREPAEWRFTGTCVQKVQTAMRLQRDLDINPPGVALALELLEEIEALRARLAVFEP